MQSDKWDGNVSWMTKLNEQNECDVDHWTSNDYFMYVYVKTNSPRGEKKWKQAKEKWPTPWVSKIEHWTLTETISCMETWFYLHLLWILIFSFPNAGTHWADFSLNHGALVALQIFYVLHF